MTYLTLKTIASATLDITKLPCLAPRNARSVLSAFTSQPKVMMFAYLALKAKPRHQQDQLLSVIVPLLIGALPRRPSLIPLLAKRVRCSALTWLTMAMDPLLHTSTPGTLRRPTIKPEMTTATKMMMSLAQLA
jgi:hypothetical protein